VPEDDADVLKHVGVLTVYTCKILSIHIYIYIYIYIAHLSSYSVDAGLLIWGKAAEA
jgi:hypothetical protein